MAELIDRLLRPVVAVALVGSLLAAAPTSAGALPPAADAGGPYSIAEGEPLVLDASGSTDPEGDPMTFAWDLDGDASFDDAFGPTPDVAWPTLVGLGLGDDGVFSIGVRTTSADGSDDDTATLVITDTEPTVTIEGTGRVVPGQSYPITITVDDPGADTVTGWTIHWGDATVESFSGSPTAASHVYATGGVFPITLSVVNEDGRWTPSDLIVPDGGTTDGVYRFDGEDATPVANLGVGGGLVTPVGSAIGPNGDLFVSAADSDLVVRIDLDTNTVIATFIGSGTLSQPGGLAFGPDGNLYVADTGAGTIERFDGISGAFIDTFVAAGSGSLTTPMDLEFVQGDLYVADAAGSVRTYDGTTGASLGNLVTGLSTPHGLAMGPNGSMYVAQLSGSTVSFHAVTGGVSGSWSNAQTSGPYGLTFGPEGRLYLAVAGTDPLVNRFGGLQNNIFESTFVGLSAGLVEPRHPIFTPSHVVQATTGVVVNSTADGADTAMGDGVCSTGLLNSQGLAQCTLRAAIQEANASAAIDLITFSIPATEAGHAAGRWTISPTTSLPVIGGDGALIDATTQPGYGGAPIVRVLGSGAGAAHGLVIAANGSSVRGLVVSAFSQTGIVVSGAQSWIADSVVGSEPTWPADGGNALGGVTVQAPDVTVERNVLSGNGRDGVYVNGISGARATIADNHIGVDVVGNTGLGNAEEGIQVNAATDTAIVGNVVSANGTGGIRLFGTVDAVIQGNLVGVGADGTTPIGNALDGIALTTGASGTLIGGPGAGDGNVIAWSQNAGIALPSAGPGNSIVGNRIHDNAALGIDLATVGVGANDVGDVDTGPNDRLNFPTITSAAGAGGLVTVDFDLDVPAGDYRIEAFANPSGVDGSGHGEGEQFVGAGVVTHPGGGSQPFAMVVSGVPGDAVSLTTTEFTAGVLGSTSEFSPTVSVSGPIPLEVNSTGNASDTVPGNGVCDTGGLNSAGAPECTLRAVIQEANAGGGATIGFDIPASDAGHVSGTWTITPSSVLPSIAAPVTIDATTQPGTVVNTTAFPAPLDSSLTVRVSGSSLPPGTHGLVLAAGSSGSEIRGLSITEFDALFANGIRVESSDNVIAGNHFGGDPAGTVALANQVGVSVEGIAADNRIGGSAPADRNLFVESTYTAVSMAGPGATGTVIQGNDIGWYRGGAPGPSSLGFGVVMFDGASGTLVGGTAPGAGNRIRGTWKAVLIDANVADSFAAVVGNHIVDSTVMGIDHANDGVDVNDAGDVDTGPNDRLNHPTITSAAAIAGTVTVDFDLDAPPGQYRVEGFVNPSGAGAGGRGEGEQFGGFTNITHSGGGPQSFALAFPGSTGDIVALTATHLVAGVPRATSEFSVAVTATGPCADTDADGLCDTAEGVFGDTDGDTLANPDDPDDDGDGRPTSAENADPNGDGDPRDALDTDRDGRPDWLDIEAGPSTTPIADEQKISAIGGGLIGPLDDEDNLGQDVIGIGDLDGDGIGDLAVGVPEDDDGGTSRGAVYVLFMNADGTVRAEQKISDTAGGFTGVLDDFDEFGHGLATIGDLDGDGVTDIAVGTWGDGDGGPARGAVWVLFLEQNGTVKAHQKISDTTGGLVAVLDDVDRFGSSLDGLGDVDGDGIADLVVGSRWDDDGGVNRGAAYVLFLNTDGTVRTEQKISDLDGGFTATLDDQDDFAYDVAGIGDLDGDGTPDVAVGAFQDDDGGPNRGAVYVLFLNADGTVRDEQKLSAAAGPLAVTLDDEDRFGNAIAGIGDIDGNGTPDLAVGAQEDDDGALDAGAVHLLRLATDGTTIAATKISATTGGLTGPLDAFDHFGRGLGSLGDLDGDGTLNLAVSARYDDDGGPNRGAVYVLDLGIGPCAVDSDADGLWDCDEDWNRDADDDPATDPGPDVDGDTIPNHLDADDDGDGVPTASENADPNGDGDPRDAVDVDRDGQPDWLDVEAGPSSTPVSDEQKISATGGGLIGPLDDNDELGQDVTALGDVDGDGIGDLAVGVPLDDDGGSNRGAVYVLFMNADGTVRAEQKISDTVGGFTGVLDNFDEFGHGLATLGDVDGDGVTDIAVGTWGDGDGGPARGAVWILFLERDGTVKAHQKISDTSGGLVAVLDDGVRFGSSLDGLGDVDGDGIADLVVGARWDDDGGVNRGAAYVLFLNADGTVRAEQKISDTAGGLVGTLDDLDEFGHSVAGLGDLDGDGIADLAVGAAEDDDGGPNRGAVYVLFMNADGTVRDEEKLSAAAGPLATALDDGDRFGNSVAGLGDIDGNGIPDLAVGAREDDDGATDTGAVHLLRLATDGTITAATKISATTGGITGPLDAFDRFGRGISSLGDLDGDGTLNLAVSARYDDDGGPERGAVYVLDLISALDTDGDGLFDHWETGFGDTDGDTQPNWNDPDDDGDGLVTSVENADPNADGDPRDALDSDRDAQPDWLDAPTSPTSGFVVDEQKISATSGGFVGALDDTDWFGRDIESIGDLDGDGVADLAVGVPLDDDGGPDRGAIYVLFMNADGTVRAEQKISDNLGGLVAALGDGDYFGHGLAAVGDLDGDGRSELAVGALFDDDGGPDRGAVYVLFLNANGTVRAERKISDAVGWPSAVLDDGDQFGVALSSIGDLDGDGLPDLAVGAWGEDDGASNAGAVYILFLDAAGNVRADQKLSNATPGLVGLLEADDQFGAALAGLGDVDGDGLPELAVTTFGDDDGGSNRGALNVLFLNADGTVRLLYRTSSLVGGLSGPIDNGDRFGTMLAGVGDLDGDGIPDLVAGARDDDDGGADRGALYVLFLTSSGTVRAEQKISDLVGGFGATLDDGDAFGLGLAAIGDLDGDGTVGLAVGAPFDDDGGTNRGAVYVLDLSEFNNAPVLDNTGNMTFTTIHEDDASNNGNTVAEIIASAGGDRITDADGDPEGIIWTDHTAGTHNGWFEYSLDGGTTWTRYGWYWNGLLLRDTDRIRFVPAGFGAETASIMFRAWDRTLGSAGDVLRTYGSGGAAAFSGASETAAMTVTAVNDVPVFGIPPQIGQGGATDTVITVDLENRGESFDAVAEMADGRIVAAGSISGDVLLARFHPDGSVDTSFGDHGYVIQPFGTGADIAEDVAIQADGKIVIAGRTNSGTDDALVARFEVDGTLDTTFGGGTGWTSIASRTAQGVAIQADGNVVIAGAGGSSLFAARLDTTGVLDVSFGTGGVVVHPSINDALDLALQSDGRLLVATDDANSIAVARLTTTGAIDTTFGGGDGIASTNLGLTGATVWGAGVAVQFDGAIVATGTAWDEAPPAWQDDQGYAALARFTNAGGLDPTFGGGDGYTLDMVPGGGSWGGMESVAIQPDGAIVTAGYFDLGYKGQNDTVVARHLTDGTLDTSFDGDGFVLTATGRYWNYLYDVLIASDGDIVAVGQSDSSDGLVIRYDTSGATTPTPASHRLDGAPTYTRGGPAVVMDGDVAAYDRELVDLPSWAGTSLTITRQGGPDPTDEFVATGNLAPLTEGGPLVLASVTVGTVTTNSGGTLTLDFTAAANRARVGQTLEALGYRNLTAVPGVSTMAWTFDDGAGAIAAGTVGVTIETFTALVNSAGDGADAAAGDGVCDTGVLNSEGDPECTLRAAIEETNARPGADSIEFAIPVSDPGHASGVWVISPVTTAPLPSITGAVTIDGSTQPGFVTGPVVAIDGTGDPFGADGLVLDLGSDGSVVRGLNIRNVPSGDALRIRSGSNSIVGNFIGTDESGNLAAPIPNGSCIQISNGAGNVIGGSGAADRNVVGGCLNGVSISGETADGGSIIGNHIGVGADGTTAIGFGNQAVRLNSGPDDVTIVDNVIGNAAANGISAFNAASSGLIIQRNLIGVAADGTTPAPNGVHGINFGAGAFDNLIGSANPTDGNIIANGTAGDGINLLSSAGSRNAILGNSIVGNGGTGIDLIDDSVTPNDPGDIDTGPNDLLNFPVITSATVSGGLVTVDFDLDLPAGTYRIEAFTNPSGADASGHGEGEEFRTAQTVVHGGSGAESFSLTYPYAAGEISLTATEDLGGGMFGSTSEFSATDVASAGSNTYVVNSTADTADALPGDGVCDTGALNAAGDPECTLRAALRESNATPALDTIEFAIPAADPNHSAGAWTITVTSALPSISAPVTIDGTTQPGAVVNTAAFPAPLDSVLPIQLQRGGGVLEGLRLAAGSDGSTIRGLSIGNFASGGGSAIEIVGSSNNVIAGNHIGMDALGSGPTPNSEGIAMFGTPLDDNRIGGTSPADRNMITANITRGIIVQGAAVRTTIQGNEIGLDTNGSVLMLGPTVAIHAISNSSETLIGGTAPGAGNRIAGHGKAVVVANSATATVIGNAIWNNSGVGIDLGDDGVTANDGGDVDTGPNDLLNTPAIGPAGVLGGTATVGVSLDVPAGTYRLEFFANPMTPSEGEQLVHTQSIVHPGGGPLAAIASFPGAAGDWYTATATIDLGGGVFGPTSEFSAPVLAVSESVVVNSTGDAPDATPGDSACDTGATNSAGAPECTLRAAVQEVNAHPVLHTIDFAIPTGEPGWNAGAPGSWTITVATELPHVSSEMHIDGSTQPGWAGTPLIEVDGTTAPSPATGLYVAAGGADSIVEQLAVVDFPNDGVAVHGDRVRLDGLHVGVRSDGVTAAGNATEGVVVFADDVVIVDSVIGNHGNAGVALFAASARTALLGNWIGTDRSGVLDFGNREGIWVDSDFSAVIGGIGPGAGNVIANSAESAVEVTGGTPTITILGNVIRNSVGVPIDLDSVSSVGVTVNDPGDGDGGSNGRQNFPETMVAVETAGTVQLDYEVDTAPGVYRLEAFVNAAAHPSGHGEGEQLVLVATITHPGGRAAYTQSFVGNAGDVVSATLTPDLGGGNFGGTSEFAQSVVVAGIPGLQTVNSTGDASDTTPGDGVCDTGATNSGGDPECTLRAAIEEAEARGGIDTIEFAIPTTDSGWNPGAPGTWTIAPATFLPFVTDPLVIDGSTQPGWSGTPVIELDGTLAPTGSGLVLHASAPGSIVEQLAIIHWFDRGIVSLAPGLRVDGNHVGVRSDGVTLAANGSEGVIVGGDDTVVVGNVIGGSPAAGVALVGGSDRVVVTGNWIGTDRSGTVALPNAQGIWSDSTGSATIGGTNPGDGNVIANNLFVGVEARTPTPTMTVLGNEIRGNGSIGIDLDSNASPGVTPNDAGDADTGANGRQNFPEAMTASALNGFVTLDYELDTLPGPYRIEAYVNPSGVDPSGYGEGEQLAFATTVNHPGGRATYSATFVGAAGDMITATATPDLGGGNFGGTSEFSASVTAVPLPSTLVVNSTADTADLVLGDGVCNTGALNSAGDPECTLRAAIHEANALAVGDTIQFAIPTSDPGWNVGSPGSWTITPTASLPDITDPLVIDGSSQPGWSGTPIVEVDGSANAAAAVGFRVRPAAPGSVIEQLAVIRFSNDGIVIDADGVRIEGNHIGVRADGTTVAGNATEGLIIAGDDAVVVGNVIGGQLFAAVSLVGASERTSLQGNWIGTDRSGTVDLGNLQAIWTSTVGSAVIGGVGPGTGNVLANSTGPAIEITAGDPTITVLGNEIRNSGGLAIDLDSLSSTNVTPNDPGDSDIGANGRQNFPDAMAAESLAGTVTLDYDLDTSPGQYRLEVYANSGGAHSSGHGEGEQLVFVDTVNHPGGTAAYTATFTGAPGDVLSATLTPDLGGGNFGGTSEFSAAVTVAQANRPPVVVSISAAGMAEGGSTVFSVAASDPDVDPLGASWDLDGDGQYDDATGATVNLAWSALVPLGIDDDGNYPIAVRVTDGALTDTASTTLVVTNTSPATALSGPSALTAGQVGTWARTTSDPGADTVSSWQIDFGDGTVATLAGTETTATHTYAAAGTYTISVEVTDEDGVAPPSSFGTVSVAAPPPPPTTTTTTTPPTTAPPTTPPSTTAPPTTAPPSTATSTTRPTTTAPGPTTTASPADGVLRAVDDEFRTSEDVALTVERGVILDNDDDPLGAGLTVELVSEPAHAEGFTLGSGGRFTYRPEPDHHGTDSFRYRVTDDAGRTSEAVVRIEIVSVNDQATLAINGVVAADPTVKLLDVTIADVDDGDRYAIVLRSAAIDRFLYEAIDVEIEPADGSLRIEGTIDAINAFLASVRLEAETIEAFTVEIELIDLGDRSSEPLPSQQGEVRVDGLQQLPVFGDVGVDELLTLLTVPGSGSSADDPPDQLALTTADGSDSVPTPSAAALIARAILVLITNPVIPDGTLMSGGAWLFFVSWFLVWRHRRPVIFEVTGVNRGDTAAVRSSARNGEVIFRLRWDATEIQPVARRFRRPGRPVHGQIEVRTDVGPGWVDADLLSPMPTGRRGVRAVPSPAPS